ncbi:PAS domain S-box protein [Candidatus Saccharibacteria bacterium]|nr:PAS domain S-box protein [Candidatus Saccharibacteria bacterium]
MNNEASRFQTLINSLGDAVFSIDRHGKIEFYNASALDIIDTHEDPIGQSLEQLVYLSDQKGGDNLLQTLIDQHQFVYRDDLIILRSGQELAASIQVNPVSRTDQSAGSVVMIRDISLQKSLERQKDEFISIISHELRTPLAIVEANLSTAIMPGFAKIEPKAIDLLESAQSNLKFLSNLLNDLTDLAHAEKSVVDLEISRLNIQELLDNLEVDFRDKFSKVGLDLQIVIPKDSEDLVILTSRQRVQEILVNFLTNAIKYGVQGKIKQVVVSVENGSEVDPNGISFFVKDFGLGISKEDQEQLFTRFFRTNNQAVNTITGTGMGLYISKTQALRLGGKITLESRLSYGSKFGLHLPAKLKQKSALAGLDSI